MQDSPKTPPRSLPVVGMFPPSLCMVACVIHKVFVDKRVDKICVDVVNIRVVFEMRQYLGDSTLIVTRS